MKLLAFEASANTVSIAVENAGKRFTSEMPASSKTSAWVIPSLLKLLENAKTDLSSLDAILFGQGPGAFTGLRTVCSVVQGLSLGLNKALPIYGVDTLQQLAQAVLNVEGPSVINQTTDLVPPVVRVLSILDARMDEWYVASYEYFRNDWSVKQSPFICHPSKLVLPLEWQGQSFTVSSNLGSSIIKDSAPSALQNQLCSFIFDSPHATLCLDLATWLVSQPSSGLSRFDPLGVTPIYIRDRVALTTREREDAKLI